MLKLLDISKISYMIQWLSSYNLLTEKVAEKILWTIYRPDEKVEFTDLTLTIYWPRNISEKAASCWKKSFFIC